MYTDVDKKMILDYLERHYPVKRYKDGSRFRRAIILDDGNIYFLNDVNSHKPLKFNMVKILSKIFDCDELIISAILDNFLPIK